ncbi:unnamed protein product [Sphagnum balticum]
MGKRSISTILSDSADTKMKKDTLVKVEPILSLYRQNSSTKAAAMSKYMKNNFKFIGIQKPERDALHKEWLREVIKSSNANQIVDYELVNALWLQEEREFQYLAIIILGETCHHLKLEDISLVETLITQKSWWDTVDGLASKVLGGLIRRFPSLADSHIRPWARGARDTQYTTAMWLRRSSIISQLKFKNDTDTQLLTEVIRENCGTQEFFLNKAIGWALREYSKSNPQWVSDFVANNTLHKLSVREALRRIK